MSKDSKAGSQTDPQRTARFLRVCCLCWSIAAVLVFQLIQAPLLPAQSLESPRRVVEGPSGQILVSDRFFSGIVAVDKSTLGVVWSHSLGEMGAPFGLAMRKDLLFVGDTITQNVLVFRINKLPRREAKAAGQTHTLEFLYNLGHTFPGQQGYFKNPIDIAVDSRKKQVFVLDGKDKKIKIYDIGGEFLREFAPTDSNGGLLSPVALAVDEARREVLVSDYGDPRGSFRVTVPARILIYGYDGTLLTQINGDGKTSPNTLFTRPKGLVTDGAGHIFLATGMAGTVLVLDRTTGALLKQVGEPGRNPGQLSLPSDVFLNSKTGDLFVVDIMGARKLEVFRAAGR